MKPRFHPWATLPLAGLIWLLLLDFSKVPLTPNPESSWAAALTDAVVNGRRFGHDIIFTYGPLAPLVVSTYAGKIFTGFFVGELLMKGFAVALLASLSRRLPTGRRLAFAAVVLAVGVLSWQAFYLLALAGVGLALGGRERGEGGWWWIGPALAFTAAVSLTKVGFLFYAAGMLGAVTLERLLARDPWRQALAPAVIFGLVFTGGWLLLGQRLGDLPGFLRGAAEITGGYSQAMSVPPTGMALTFGLLLVGLTVGQALVLAARSPLRSRWRVLPRGMIVAGALLLAWKLGFVRADNHVIEWFLFAALAVAAMPLFFGGGERDGGFHWVCLLVAVGLAGAAAGFQDPGIGRTLAGRLEARWRENQQTLRNPRARAAAERASVEQQRQLYALPRIRGAVARASVDVFGVEQSLAILNGMNYAPRPVFEGYSAYTPHLLRANLDFFRSERAPEFVLFRLQPLDNRAPTLEDGPVLMTLARAYEPALAEEGYLLLRRRPGAAANPVPPPADFPPVANGEFSLGETLTLPETGDGLWCELEMRETLVGKLLRFFYQQPPVVLETEFTGQISVPRRLVPGMARGGFLLSPQPASEGEFLRFMGGGDPPLRTARAVRVPDSAELRRVFEPRIAYRLFRVPPPAPGSGESVREVGAQLARFPDIFIAQPSVIRSGAPTERVTVEGRPFLQVHAAGEMEFAIPPGARRVSGQFTIRPEAWQVGATDGVEFRIDYAPDGGATGPTTLLDRVLDPAAQPGDRPVQTFDLELPPGALGRLIFRTLPGPAGNGSWDWSCWSGVRFEEP